MRMAKKRKVQRQTRNQPVQKKNSDFWMITAIIAIILLVGVAAKLIFSSSQTPAPITTIQPTAVQSTTSMASKPVLEQVRLVAINFKCACGGCGELLLAECECNMPRGAVEEKSFIRTKLIGGHTVPQVIELVNKKYGHRVL